MIQLETKVVELRLRSFAKSKNAGRSGTSEEPAWHKKAKVRTQKPSWLCN